MLRFTVRELARLVSGLTGATLLAIALASLSSPGTSLGVRGFPAILIGRANSFVRLDFGVSAVSGRPAIVELAHSLPQTLIVLAFGSAIALAAGAPLGILFGGGPIRRAAAPIIQFIAATPVFCAALALDYLASRWFGFRPSAGPVPETASLSTFSLQPFLLPSLTVGAAGAAQVQLVLRSASADVARQPYRRGLRRLGLSDREIEWTFVVPDVLASFARSLGELALALIAASAVAEWVFDLPGAAVLFVKSVALSDWGMAALVLLVFSAIAITADFLGRMIARTISGPVPT